MSGNHHCDVLPETTFTLTVTYCLKHQAWRGTVNMETLTADGSTINQDYASREFGPFASYIDVGRWMAGEVTSLKHMPRLATVDAETGTTRSTPAP